MASMVENNGMSPSPYLKAEERPAEINSRINEVFQSLRGHRESDWGLYNGDNETYFPASFKDKEMIKRLIMEAPADQKDFYILDVGAGKFQWGETMVKYLNEQADLRGDIQIHILGVRAEQFIGEKTVSKGRCILHRIGAFKVEEIGTQLAEHVTPEAKIDFVVSSWCLRHLVDPVGTFAQIYNLLRPKTGIALFDGFLYGVKKGDAEVYGNLTRLFLNTTAPFLVHFYDGFGALNHFLLKRPDDSPCCLPMKYAGMKRLGDYHFGSDAVTIFERGPQEKERTLSGSHYQITGNRELFDWAKQNDLLSSMAADRWVEPSK
jgi:SAM-dependent methyltransferase